MEPSYDMFNSGYSDSLNIGNEFQDFVCTILAKELNWYIQNFNSKRYQYKHGENLQRVEIKYDARCTGDRNTLPTNRLSIEIAEKKRVTDLEYIDSGIYSVTDSLFYVQGNYMMFWVFPTKYLRLIHKNKKLKEHQEPTVRAFYIPIIDADNWCIYKYINK